MDSVDTMDSMDALVEHLRLVWCGGDEKTFIRLTNYFKKLLIDPESLRDHALIVVGPRAIGKTIIFNLLRKAIEELFPDSVENNSTGVAKLFQSKYQHFETYRYFEEQSGSECAKKLQCANKMQTKLFIFSEASKKDLLPIFELAQLFHSILLITSFESIYDKPSSYFWELRCKPINESENEHENRMKKIASISTKDFINYFCQNV